MEEELDIKLEEYYTTDVYPFHMPGHKRRNIGIESPYKIDITEIDGFDVLGEPTGILEEAQNRAAKLYGSRQSYYLVNGSTGGMLSAISAGTKRGGKILMARNMHKSAYHAAFLKQLKIEYLSPAVTKAGILGAILPEQVEKKLMEHSDIQAVVLTSPTYEGVVSDIVSIANITHRYKIPLIVDEAHGAHFGLAKGFPLSAVTCGADVVVQSMHKTLPSLTQTGLLHLNSDYVSTEQVERYLNIYQTSSPSYVFLAGIEKCIRLLNGQRVRMFEKYKKQLDKFYEETCQLKHIELITEKKFNKNEFFALDPSKIIISVKNTNMTGEQLYHILLEKYHLQMEMASGFYVLAMTSIMDEDFGFERLSKALFSIDSTLITKKWKHDGNYVIELYKSREKGMEFSEAFDHLVSEVDFQDALGKMAGNFVYLYPPGIPVIIPGEIITEEFLEQIEVCVRNGLCVKGDKGIINHRINVVNF